MAQVWLTKWEFERLQMVLESKQEMLKEDHDLWQLGLLIPERAPGTGLTLVRASGVLRVTFYRPDGSLNTDLYVQEPSPVLTTDPHIESIHPRHVPLAEKYVGQACTLGGKRATIQGRTHRFATVATLDPPHLTAEFAWGVVERVMTVKDGQFQDS